MAKLLIVDDDHQTCDYLKEFFERRKCVVCVAHSGEEGISLVAQEKPNIVLLDVKMKGIDGLETLAQVKAHTPTTKVIVMTGAADDDIKAKAIELGADDFIKKPFNMNYLEGTVSSKVTRLFD